MRGSLNLIDILFADNGDKYLYTISSIYISEGLATVVVNILLPFYIVYLPVGSIKYKVIDWLIYSLIIDTPLTVIVKLLAG